MIVFMSGDEDKLIDKANSESYTILSKVIENIYKFSKAHITPSGLKKL
jgi:hypothetical protein